MGTNNRREVAKRLAQEIAKTTDPKTLIELSSLLAKMQPTKRRQRKPVEKPAEGPKKKKRSLREIYTGSVYKAMSDDDLVIHHLVMLIEKRQREQGRKFTPAERDAFVAQVLGSVPENERAAYEALERYGGVA